MSPSKLLMSTASAEGLAGASVEAGFAVLLSFGMTARAVDVLVLAKVIESQSPDFIMLWPGLELVKDVLPVGPCPDIESKARAQLANWALVLLTEPCMRASHTAHALDYPDWGKIPVFTECMSNSPSACNSLFGIA